MKRILVSWYGISDLRACVGMLPGEHGPVLGALLTGEYDEAHILQYTETGKPCPFPSPAELRAAAADSPGQAEFIRQICNTPQANRRFGDWLQEELGKAGVQTRLHFHAKEWTGLNDSAAVFHAVTDTMDRLVKDPAPREITLNLSPGTPVMAYVWAMASLRYPDENIKLVTSSRPAMPPETVELPPEWRSRLEPATVSPWSGETYDIMFHLYSEQRMPVYAAMIQFKARKHILVSNPGFDHGKMRGFSPMGCQVESRCLQRAFDINGAIQELSAVARDIPPGARVAFNVTCGTKPMYAAALEVCRAFGFQPVYIDLKNFKAINPFNNDSAPLSRVRFEMANLVMLNSNFEVHCGTGGNGSWKKHPARRDDERWRLTCHLMEHAADLQKFYPKPYLTQYDINYRQNVDNKWEVDGCVLKLNLNTRGDVHFSFMGKTFEFHNWPYFLKYLCGGWFEEYTCRQVVAPLLAANLIKDLRFEWNVFMKSGEKNIKVQEMDVAFTDGKRLFVIECKSGVKLFPEHVYKLRYIQQNYGGLNCVAILCSATDCTRDEADVVRQRAAFSDFHCCSIHGLDALIRDILNKPEE